MVKSLFNNILKLQTFHSGLNCRIHLLWKLFDFLQGGCRLSDTIRDTSYFPCTDVGNFLLMAGYFMEKIFQRIYTVYQKLLFTCKLVRKRYHIGGKLLKIFGNGRECSTLLSWLNRNYHSIESYQFHFFTVIFYLRNVSIYGS